MFVVTQLVASDQYQGLQIAQTLKGLRSEVALLG